jgi:hypothetical protein
LCNSKSVVNQLNHEQFTEFQKQCTHLSLQYSKELNGLELYQDYKSVIIFLKKAKKKWEELDFSPNGLLRYISSVGLGTYKALATGLEILLTAPLFNSMM